MRSGEGLTEQRGEWEALGIVGKVAGREVDHFAPEGVAGGWFRWHHGGKDGAELSSREAGHVPRIRSGRAGEFTWKTRGNWTLGGFMPSRIDLKLSGWKRGRSRPAIWRVGLVLLGLGLVSCQTGDVPLGLAKSSGSVNAVTGSNMPREVTFWQPWLLYTHGSPYRRIHVEVDYVEGTEPRAEWLEGIRKFLAKECSKPGGVTVRLDDRIPRARAAQLSSSAMALTYIDGPPPGEAFMYVLYYDSGLNRSLKTSNPHAVAFPYPCAVFIDRAYNQKGFGDNVGGEVLLHEIAHLVGTARSFSHGDGAHCRRRNCIMNEAFEYHPERKWVSGQFTAQQEFCPECLQDLARWRSSPPDPGLRFDGPLLVRNAGDYQVYSLPHAVHLHAGPASAANREKVLQALRAVVAAGRSNQEQFIVSASAEGSPEEVWRALQQAKADPARPVKAAAEQLDRQLGQKQAAAGTGPALVPATPPS